MYCLIYCQILEYSFTNFKNVSDLKIEKILLKLLFRLAMWPIDLLFSFGDILIRKTFHCSLSCSDFCK